MTWDLHEYGDFIPECITQVYGIGAEVKGVLKNDGEEAIELWISLLPEDADRVYDLVEEGRQREALEHLSRCPWQGFSF